MTSISEEQVQNIIYNYKEAWSHGINIPLPKDRSRLLAMHRRLDGSTSERLRKLLPDELLEKLITDLLQQDIEASTRAA